MPNGAGYSSPLSLSESFFPASFPSSLCPFGVRPVLPVYDLFPRYIRSDRIRSFRFTRDTGDRGSRLLAGEKKRGMFFSQFNARYRSSRNSSQRDRSRGYIARAARRIGAISPLYYTTRGPFLPPAVSPLGWHAAERISSRGGGDARRAASTSSPTAKAPGVFLVCAAFRRERRPIVTPSGNYRARAPSGTHNYIFDPGQINISQK